MIPSGTYSPQADDSLGDL